MELEEIFYLRVRGRLEDPIPSIPIIETISLINKGVSGAIIKQLARYIPSAIVADCLGVKVSTLRTMNTRQLSKLQTDQLNDLTAFWLELRVLFNDKNEPIMKWINCHLPSPHSGTRIDLMGTAAGRNFLREFITGPWAEAIKESMKISELIKNSPTLEKTSEDIEWENMPSKGKEFPLDDD